MGGGRQSQVGEFTDVLCAVFQEIVQQKVIYGLFSFPCLSFSMTVAVHSRIIFRINCGRPSFCLSILEEPTSDMRLPPTLFFEAPLVGCREIIFLLWSVHLSHGRCMPFSIVWYSNGPFQNA